MLPGLRHERLIAGMTQEELAGHSGVHRDTIQKLEAGDRPARPATIRKLADALAVDAQKLTEEGGRITMDEAKTVMVHALYPNLSENADLFKRWDGSREAWLWESLMDYRDRCMVETLAATVAELGEGADLPGLLLTLWNFIDREEAEEFIEAHKGQIERLAAERIEES